MNFEKLLMDENMNKKYLGKLTGISTFSIAISVKNENVDIDILLKICIINK